VVLRDTLTISRIIAVSCKARIFHESGGAPLRCLVLQGLPVHRSAWI
jgi:hypothetical protein